MIHDDLIVYRPPSKGQISNVCDSEDCYRRDLRLVNYRYARLCSIIVKTLYSHASLKMSPSESMKSLRRLSTMLNAWRLSIPARFRPNSEVDLTDSPALSQGCFIQSDLGLKHAEASFAIHRWAIMEIPVSQFTTADYIVSRDECVATAKAVIISTQGFRVHDSEMDWYVRQLEEHYLLLSNF